ncbi:terpene synthase family protein [Cecembia rubra]|uniref:Terpene synthase family protein n=1 Tax=Cecembia rubra TaxID=1485585 RepID=A0A2P8E0T7_9BACT|nr:hypothetical protein [Cecembia rubra]PSL03083.1 terpene synthase family protein [Cecembia rubra]
MLNFERKSHHLIHEHELVEILERWYPTEMACKEVLRIQVLSWLKNSGIINGEENLKVFEKTGIHCFAARLFPLAEPSDLDVISKLFALLFIMDDMADQLNDGDFWKTVQTTPSKIAGNISDQRLDFMDSILDLIFTSKWGMGDCLRLLYTVIRFVGKGEEEQQIRKKRQTPSLKKYWSIKTESSGFQIAWTLLHILFPQNKINAQLLSRLNRLIAKIIILENDIMSFHKESLIGDVFNMVHLRMERFGESKICATNFVKNFIEDLKGQFAQICLQHLPTLPLECFSSDAFEKGLLIKHQEWHSLASMWCLVKGSHIWATMDTNRYNQK